MSARPQRRLATLAVIAALVGLAGCDKPTPSVTLYSGGSTVRDSAFSYCFGGQDPTRQQGAAGACRYDADRSPAVLQVRPGDQVTVDVDNDLTDTGWYVALRAQNAEPSRLAVSTEHVVRFQPDFSKATTLFVEVRKLQAPRDDARAVGFWVFAVVPRT